MSKTWNALSLTSEAERRPVSEAPNREVVHPDAGERRAVRPQPIPHPTSSGESQSAERLDFSKIGVVEARRIERILYHTTPTSSGADKFRLLRMRLRTHRTLNNLKSLLVTSPLPKDGKTTTVLNLATALTEQRIKRVLVIDADLHRRGVEEELQLEPCIGIAECLMEGVDPLTVLRRVEPLGWHLLSAGIICVESPSELLRPVGLSALLQRIVPHFDWILIDSPPVLPLTDALALAQVVDGCLVIARAGQTPTKAIEDAINALGRKHIVGLVLNGLERSNQRYSKYQNYYRPAKSTDSSGA